jgi:SAM-dependent methyltransferase
MDMATFYSTLRQRGHAMHAHQWCSLVTCAQERLVYAKALERVAPQSRVLDWGCGNGHFSYFLAEHGYHPDSYALGEIPPLLHQEKRISFTKGENRTSLPYPASTFDAVFALGVIEHVAEHGGSERASLAELARVLKPGGLLLMFHLPNRWSWIEGAKWCTWRLGLTQTREHLRRFTRDDFLNLLSGLPFKAIEEGRYHFLPRATLGRLPGLRDSRVFCAAIDRLDDLLAWALRPIAQNHYFLLRKEPA